MKKILALLLVALMIVGMTACGGADKKDPTTASTEAPTTAPTTKPSESQPSESQPSESQPAESQPSESQPAESLPPVSANTEKPAKNPNADALPLTIKVWTPAEDQAVDNNWLETMQAQFDAAHPEYNITWINESVSEGDAASMVTTDVSAAADIYMFANDQLGGLITAGGLAKQGGIYLDQIKNDNSQFMINTVTHTDGAQYAFPVTNNTWFLYYNKDVFTEEDVKSLDTMITKGKVCIPITTGWNAGCFFLGCGGTIFGEAGNDASVGIQFGEDHGGYKAAKKMIELVGNSNIVAGGMDTGRLIEGEVAAVFSGSWSAAELRENLGDKLGVAALPTFTVDGETYNMTAMSGSKCVGVNPTSGSVKGKQKACTQFAAFLASADAQLARYAMRGVIPAHKDLISAVANDPVAMAEINTINNSAVIQSALPQMGKYWSPVENFGKSVANGEINMGNYMDMVDQMNNQLNAEGL